MVYQQVLQEQNRGRKQLAVLVDPDKHTKNSLIELIKNINIALPDFIFIGGSLVSQSIDWCVKLLKENVQQPVVLFPGSVYQISHSADAILFLSLISGRNSEFLIGNHVVAAPLIKNSHLEVISTGYMLIENGSITSVEYMSNTKPIPRNKIDIAVATAIAGQMLGQKLIYLDAGSGAKLPVDGDMIAEVKKNINIPLMVGGGLNSITTITKACEAGADIIVVGSAFEKNPGLLDTFVSAIKTYPKK